MDIITLFSLYRSDQRGSLLSNKDVQKMREPLDSPFRSKVDSSP